MKAKLYNDLYELQEGLCAECGTTLPDRFLTNIDRIIPGAEGGGYVLENCRIICLPCDWEKEGNRPQSRYPELRTALENYKMWQRTRKRLNMTMQASAKTPYASDTSLGEMEFLFEHAGEYEKQFAKLLAKMVKEIPLGRRMLKVKGTGPITAALLLSRVDIEKARYPSSLWKFFGLAGPSKDRYKEGVTGGGSREDRALLRQWSESQIRHRTPYRAIYDERRSRTDNEDKWKSDAHRMADALRVMLKIFLAHFWEVYRKEEGLPTPEPYAMKQLGHAGYLAPEEFGW